MEAGTRDSLTIGDLAHRTGVPTTTLRSWEKRYGFPRPTRQGGGHRRYAETDVEAVLDVLERRRGGLSLAAAVRRAPGAPVRSGSLFAELRRRHPLLQPQVLGRRTLVAMSHAIEDECAARAAEPLLFGGFQRDSFLGPSFERWSELARTARLTAVFTDVEGPYGERLLADPSMRALPLPHDSPLNREWLVVCDAEDLPACLAAVERPGQTFRSPGRRFEAVWSVDPVVVRDASRIAAALADEIDPDWRADGELELLEPAPASDDLHRATQLFDRMIGYLDADARSEVRVT